VKTVVALGGNALMRPGERGTAAEQLANLRRAVQAMTPLLEEPGLVIAHGNGPQVGNELLRQERAADEAPPLPLWLAVAQTQAEIGALILTELRASVGRAAACVLTHVRVAPDDPAFDRPTKPVGPFYSLAQGEELQRERGWAMVSDANRGFRRVVPSPSPLEVVELEQIRALANAGTIVVACGGGGIPVVRRGRRLVGVDAVIDKDRASALLARALGAERLLILTEVPAVYRDFGGPDQGEIRELSHDDARRLLPELAEGSMRPKVEAAILFGRATLITNFDALAAALDGCGGTRIQPRQTTASS
jgi:carbamate kinase